MGGPYHLVCRECAFEAIYAGRTDARSEQDGHDADHGHRTTLLDIGEQPTE
jgi:hypothetical protein